jgi:hypothetical protein
VFAGVPGLIIGPSLLWGTIGYAATIPSIRTRQKTCAAMYIIYIGTVIVLLVVNIIGPSTYYINWEQLSDMISTISGLFMLMILIATFVTGQYHIWKLICLRPQTG